MRSDTEDNVIMPVFCTRLEIDGIHALLSMMQHQHNLLEAAADIDLSSLEQLYLVGSGDSYAIALMVEQYLHGRGWSRCRAIQSFDFSGLSPEHFSVRSLVVVISASGRPSPVMDALIRALMTNARVIGVTNAAGSPFADLTPRMLFTGASKKGIPTQSSSAMLFLLLALAARILQAKQTPPGVMTLDIERLSLGWQNACWQRWLTANLDAFYSRRVVFLGKGMTMGLAWLGSNLMSCGPQIEASCFHIEEYCHALRLNQANQQHLVMIFPEKRGDQPFCSSVQQRLNRQGALSYCFIPAEDIGAHDYLQRTMLLLFRLSLMLAEHYLAMGGIRVKLEDIK